MNGRSFWVQLKRVPTPLALLVGLFLGLLLGRSLPSNLALPTIDQRRRVLELLSTLSPHHTAECTRSSQPLYIQQVRERYKSLVGFDSASQASWLSSFDFGFGDPQHVHLTPTKEHKYFFAINLYNSFDIIPDLFATLFRVSAILGYHNVYVSIYENGSSDQTKALLRIFSSLTQSVGLRVTIRTSTRTRGAFNHRIEYLAEVRNQAFNPLYELRDTHNEYFDTILFMNDILPCVDDILELLWQSRRHNAGITCAADYMYHEELSSPVFYDNWMQSCWNGVAVLDPAPFYTPPYVRFRMAKLAENECSASECSLICNDYWEAGYGRILMVPRVKLAYDKKVFDIIHPQRRNLTAIRGYVRLGGLPDNPRTDPQDRSWFGPHDRLFTPEESEDIEFVPGPSHVWCWGWDGAGDIDGPDVDPIWEGTPSRSQKAEAVTVKHQRSMDGL
ncbi:glycosyltransferase family 69 protein [Chiua virens]|nr:glycosyltransferase family 69 protein [Chiua virens]